MKKLELEHLQHYPAGKNGLKIYDSYSDDYKRFLGFLSNAGELIALSNNVIHHRRLDEIKPVFHPLSDLIKEIELNGKKFIPLAVILNIEKEKYFFEKWSGLKKHNDWSVISAWWFNTEENENPTSYEELTTWHLDRLSFKDAQMLFKWRFDVFGYIESGLAIDINTL